MIVSTHGRKTPVDLIRRKSLDALDYSDVRAAVVEHTTFPLAEELARAIAPVYTAREIEELQRETRDGVAYLEESGDPDLSTNVDATEAVDRAGLGGVLTGKELLEVADSLEVLGRARSAFARNTASAPVLAEIASGIPDLLEVQRQVRSKIGIRGEVLDSATPTLGALRRSVRASYQRAVEALERVMRSPVGEDALQDNVISVRSDRLVLQVRTELRHKVPGIVHDVSRTDATLFIEPFATVDACNTWRELSLEEDQETRRVLMELSELVGAVADDIRTGMRLTARLDFIMARARYSARLNGVPVRVGDDESDDALVIQLVKARHPLLGNDAVPVSVGIGAESSVLVITGPNTGGKTVAMKTVGLLAAMHQSGLQVSAEEGSSVPVYEGIYADVGDRQSIERSVSTFSSHMRNVIDILGDATASSLVLLDEIGTSTDPEEGSALARAVLDNLAERGITTVATTHYRAVAAHAEGHPGMSNASVQLDAQTLLPTYELTLGVPGRSYAMSIAANLGLPGPIMEKAKSLIEPRHVLFEDWLSELQRDRQKLRERTEEMERAGAQARLLRRELEERIDYLVTHREEMLDGVRRELTARYEQVSRKAKQIEAAAYWQPAAGELEQARADIEDTKRELDEEMERLPARPRPAPGRPVAEGDSVVLKGLDMVGRVLSVSEDEGEAEVSLGKVRLRIDTGRLKIVDAPEPDEPAAVSVSLGPVLASADLDIRGSRADEALAALEQFLDRAMRDGLGSVRIIHGKGTGALRQAVREHLERHPLARSFESEAPNRGGSGVTAVKLS
jgi:DNA mismatch repair protein MutS2